jgi:acyl dehydratase
VVGPGPRSAAEGARPLDGATVVPGMPLPPLAVPITRTLIVAGAIATRDYQDVHHDVELARANGAPDIFMNILTTNGLVGRYATDWAGPAAVIERISIRLGAPNYPGDTMLMSGEVTGCEPDGASVRVELAVRGANSLGDHVTGTVRLRLPCAVVP